MANENKLLKTNSVKIIGTLTNADVKTGNRKEDGQGYISATATVVARIDNVENEYKVTFYANQMTKDGKVSKLYESYENMPELVGHKVEIDGEIRENRYFSTNTNLMVSTQQLSGKFIKGVVASTVDTATFLVGGFLAKTLVEKRNKDGEVYRYDLAIGQSNYSGTGMNVITLHVNPNDRDIISGIENTYQLGDTVQFKGNLVFTVTTVTVEDKNTAFGAPISKTYTNRQSNFYITSGSNPVTNETAYSREVITALNNAYKANDTVLQSRATSGAEPKANATLDAAPVATKRQTSLI